MPASKVADRLRHLGQELHRLACDPLSQLQHVLDVLRLQVALGQPLVSLTEVLREARRSVAVHANVDSLDFIERGPNLVPAQG